MNVILIFFCGRNQIFEEFFLDSLADTFYWSQDPVTTAFEISKYVSFYFSEHPLLKF